MSGLSSTATELRMQWTNPSDILSLLLLIGDHIVRKAIAQLVGWTVQLPGKPGHNLHIAPVAFSFGWVAYGFTNLLSAVGEKQLMPLPDCALIVVNCANAHTRSNKSWVLGRLLRDHEAKNRIDPSNPPGRAESIRIDIFELENESKPDFDGVWWLGWLTMIIQIGIAIPPWKKHGDWGTMMVVLCGNLFALFTCALPQWNHEKWAGRALMSDKVTCLTRGNGHHHIMVLIGSPGCWDIESLATAAGETRSETPYLSTVLALLWTCLLISVAGLRNNAWYLVVVGGVGMLQNIYAAGTSRKPGTAGIHLNPYKPMPTIIGLRRPVELDEDDAFVQHDDTNDLSTWTAENDNANVPNRLNSMDQESSKPEWLIPVGTENVENVQGALIELEKWIPTAGIAMLQVFFPNGLGYNDHAIKYNIHKRWWKKAYHTYRVRRNARVKKRRIARGLGIAQKNEAYV